MDPDLRHALDRLHEKLDRLLDPETGVYARIHEQEAKTDERFRVGRMGLIAVAVLAGGERIVSLILHLLG